MTKGLDSNRSSRVASETSVITVAGRPSLVKPASGAARSVTVPFERSSEPIVFGVESPGKTIRFD